MTQQALPIVQTQQLHINSTNQLFIISKIKHHDKKKYTQETLINLPKTQTQYNKQQPKRKKKLITTQQVGTKVGVPMDSKYDIYKGWKI